MYNLGGLVVSKEAQQKYKLSFILERLEEFKQDARHYFESDENRVNVPFHRRFEKAVYHNGEFVLHIKSIKDETTTVLEASEYIGSELNDFVYRFKADDIEFLKGVLERDKPTSERGESRYYRRNLADFEKLEKLKQQLGK